MIGIKKNISYIIYILLFFGIIYYMHKVYNTYNEYILHLLLYLTLTNKCTTVQNSLAAYWF